MEIESPVLAAVFLRRDASTRHGGQYHYVLGFIADRWVMDSSLPESVQWQGMVHHGITLCSWILSFRNTDRRCTSMFSWCLDLSLHRASHMPTFPALKAWMWKTETHFYFHIERVADDTGDGTYNHLAQNHRSSNGASESVGEVSLLDSTLMWINVATLCLCESLWELRGSEIIVVFLSTASDGEQFYAISQQAAVALLAWFLVLGFTRIQCSVLFQLLGTGITSEKPTRCLEMKSELPAGFLAFCAAKNDVRKSETRQVKEALRQFRTEWILQMLMWMLYLDIGLLDFSACWGHHAWSTLRKLLLQANLPTLPGNSSLLHAWLHDLHNLHVGHAWQVP